MQDQASQLELRPEGLVEPPEADLDEGLLFDRPVPIPFPIWPVSGLYVRNPLTLGTAGSSGLRWDAYDLFQYRLRLDVDRNFPQKHASGTIGRRSNLVHWVAKLHPVKGRRMSWVGEIIKKAGNKALLPYFYVRIDVPFTLPSHPRTAVIRFGNGLEWSQETTYTFLGTHFREVDVEIDATPDARPPVLQYETHSHPTRPSTLAAETLTIAKVYARAGIKLNISPTVAQIPEAKPGPDGWNGADGWDYSELHDAMEQYWSRYRNYPQWAMWMLYADHYFDRNRPLLGVMFDFAPDQRPNRQGCVIFTQPWLYSAPFGDPNPAAWSERLKFFCACHEMGHAFNLAHSFQKEFAQPWLPLVSDTESRSIMNYPQFVQGGQAAYFSSFEFRFSDQEMLFMRHAPDPFVQMGGDDWFNNHGLDADPDHVQAPLQLEVRVNRSLPVFEFMEPVVLEMKLKNCTDQPALVSSFALKASERMLLRIQKRGAEPKVFRPYFHALHREGMSVLAPGEAQYESLFVSAGARGWQIAEPGFYTIELAMEVNGMTLTSLPLEIRITPPHSYEEEAFAQDYFSDQVGRILQFDGSRVLTPGLDTLRDSIERFGNRRVAVHSRVALACSMLREGRILDLSGTDNGPQASKRFIFKRADPSAAAKLMRDALLAQPGTAAETLAHIDFRHYGERYADALALNGMVPEAVQTRSELQHTLAVRGAKPAVLAEMEARTAALAAVAEPGQQARQE